MEALNRVMELARTEDRRKMFLAATLRMGKLTARCRIRDMTRAGALVECESTIPIGTTVVIARGELSVAGEVKWSRSTHFGMKFSDSIEIHKWLSEPSTIHPFTARKAVSRVAPKNSVYSAKDELILDTKTINQRLYEELNYISRIIDGIGEVLVKDPVLRVRHATSLQQLDMGQQMLSEIAQIVTRDDKVDCISQVATGSMRGRLLRAKPI